MDLNMLRALGVGLTASYSLQPIHNRAAQSRHDFRSLRRLEVLNAKVAEHPETRARHPGLQHLLSEQCSSEGVRRAFERLGSLRKRMAKFALIVAVMLACAAGAAYGGICLPTGPCFYPCVMGRETTGCPLCVCPPRCRVCPAGCYYPRFSGTCPLCAPPNSCGGWGR
ncbi:hypothetical protein ISCGN_008762 [Ixodes scapularis]